MLTRIAHRGTALTVLTPECGTMFLVVVSRTIAWEGEIGKGVPRNRTLGGGVYRRVFWMARYRKGFWMVIERGWFRRFFFV